MRRLHRRKGNVRKWLNAAFLLAAGAAAGWKVHSEWYERQLKRQYQQIEIIEREGIRRPVIYASGYLNPTVRYDIVPGEDMAGIDYDPRSVGIYLKGPGLPENVSGSCSGEGVEFTARYERQIKDNEPLYLELIIKDYKYNNLAGEIEERLRRRERISPDLLLRWVRVMDRECPPEMKSVLEALLHYNGYINKK